MIGRSSNNGSMRGRTARSRHGSNGIGEVFNYGKSLMGENKIIEGVTGRMPSSSLPLPSSSTRN